MNRFRIRQAWTIAKLEMRRAFFSKRAFWVYGLALFPTVVFLAHAVEVKVRERSLCAQGLKPAALIDSVRQGETEDAVVERLGTPVYDWKYMDRRRGGHRRGASGDITTHRIKETPARFVRLNVITPAQDGNEAARIYEFEVYGPDSGLNLALRHPAIGSEPCDSQEGPEKAFNGSVSGGSSDKWCSTAQDKFLQVDLGAVRTVNRFVIQHAGAGGEDPDWDTRDFNIQVSTDGTHFNTVVEVKTLNQPDAVRRRTLTYFDGRRQARFTFTNGVLESKSVHPLFIFDEDRQAFAGVFQYYYLRLAIFFGCLGIFMNLFRGEMLDKTLHYWLLAPARREVLLAGKYFAGLIASTVIFTLGALLCFGVMLWINDAAEVQAYWQGPGPAHAFWYAAAAALGCVGYGSVFLAAGLLLRNPIVPAAILLIWENINGFLPSLMQKMTVLYYLQSLCPVAAPMDSNAPPLIKLLLASPPAASRFSSVVGLLALTALVLWAGSYAVRRIQISYGTE